MRWAGMSQRDFMPPESSNSFYAWYTAEKPEPANSGGRMFLFKWCCNITGESTQYIGFCIGQFSEVMYEAILCSVHTSANHPEIYFLKWCLILASIPKPLAMKVQTPLLIKSAWADLWKSSQKLNLV